MEEPACAGSLITINVNIRPEFLIVVLSLKLVDDDDEIKIGINFQSSDLVLHFLLPWTGRVMPSWLQFIMTIVSGSSTLAAPEPTT